MNNNPTGKNQYTNGGYGGAKLKGPKKFQVKDMSGRVVKVFHGASAEHQARQHISKNQNLRLSIRNVSFGR